MSNFGTLQKPKRVLFNTREAWLQNRQGIGSSEIATIVGLNPYETPYQLWLRKTNRVGEVEDNPAMKSGRFLEDAVCRFFEDATGREVIKNSAGDILYIHPEKPFLRVTPDRLYWLDGTRNEDNKAILECKTTQMKIDEDDIPKHWFCQVQYQMGVMQKEHCTLAWLSGGRDFHFKDIDFVPDFYLWLEEEAQKFWVNNVIGGIQPDIANVSDVLAIYAKHTPDKMVEGNDELYDTYTKLVQAKADQKANEEKITELEDRLKLALLDAEALTYKGRTLVTWKASKDSVRFDAIAYQLADPITYAKYLKSFSGSRRFLLKD